MTDHPSKSELASQPTAVGVVLPGDNRQAVHDTSVPPSPWIGQLSATFANSGGIGTATLLDEYHVLTCAHNFYNTTNGEARSAAFTPALTRAVGGQLVRPYPPIPVARWALPDDYRRAPAPLPPQDGTMLRDITKYLYDYAVARLSRPTTVPPTMFQCAGIPPNFDGTMCGIVGYSGDLDPTACTQYRRGGAANLDPSHDFVMYKMSTFNGDSGAAVCYQPAGRPFYNVVAVHVSGHVAVGVDAGFNFGPALPDPAIITALIDQSDRQ